MLRDQVNLLEPVVAIAPQVATNSDTAIASAIIDCQGVGALSFIILLGTVTDTDVTAAVTLEHGDASNLSDTAAVTAADLIGQTSSAGTETATALANAGFTFAADGKCRKIGYCGNKRYVKLTVTPTGNNSGALPIACLALKGMLDAGVAVNPPAMTA
jgi:hypothetical protein